MPENAVLDTTFESTGSGSVDYTRIYSTQDWLKSAHQVVPERPYYELALGSRQLSRLLDEELHSVFHGTNALGKSSWNTFLGAIVLELLNAGFEHGTQYMVRVEPVTPFMPFESLVSTAQLNVQQATELTQQAIALSGLTHEQLATAMGVSRQAVQNWLRAKSGMSSDNQERLSELIALFQRAKNRIGNPKQVSRWLLTSWREDGPTPLNLLANSRIGAARGQLLRSKFIGQSTVETINKTSGHIPRRTVNHGYSPSWTQPLSLREMDPEEGLNFQPEEESPEPYRGTNNAQVTGLALA